MKKAALLKRLGTNRAIADVLGISVQAVTRWPTDGNVPKKRVDQLRYEQPEIYRQALRVRLPA